MATDRIVASLNRDMTLVTIRTRDDNDTTAQVQVPTSSVRELADALVLMAATAEG